MQSPPKYLLFGFVAVLLVSLLILFRLQIVNTFQVLILENIKEEAVLANNRFNPFSKSFHAIYSLRGIERFFPHRVNSLKRLAYLYDDFSGFECDAHYSGEKDQILISHDAPSPNEAKLEDFLKADDKHKLFWLDVKNLDAKNVSAFIKKLAVLEGLYKIENRIIIESSNIEALRAVTAAGYFTSYYATDPHQAAVKASVKALCVAGDAEAATILSFDQKYAPTIGITCLAKKHLSWDLSFRLFFDQDKLARYANDTTLLVCLLNIKSPGYR